MTEKARRQDGEEARDERESLPAEMSHELAPERDTQRDLTGATTSETDDVPAPDAAIAGATESTASTETTERPRARRTSRKPSTRCRNRWRHRIHRARTRASRPAQSLNRADPCD